MKRKAWIILGIAAMFALSGCGNGGLYKDGVYEGKSRGATSDIVVAVTVKSSKIESVEVKQHEETAQMIQAVTDNTVPEIIEKQGADEVEALTGATKSSEGVIAAVKQALEQAKK
ncbi:FMN-binding protein [Paenibacillus sp. SC116]|uniref:FMN-binding protein n=1 Tax=Paenibacillus sp. SC116 TaxID=2968986 RepID=UPI00215ABCCA|nr:FMN-binding protein [Paenibacillus sp. SC116]MCR8844658.1 FMN-binding protein [Paenibacillus sp. SC116]